MAGEVIDDEVRRYVTFDEFGHGGELHFVVAEETPEGWRFYRRSCFEMQWYRVPATIERLESVARLGR